MKRTPPALPPSIEVDAPTSHGDGPAMEAAPLTPDSPSREGGLWFVAAALLRGRWVVLGVTTLVAICAVAISLQLPNWYAATARVLPPESSGASPITAALMRGSGGAAAALLGTGHSDYSRYLSILSSRRVLEDLVDEFNLVEVYEVQDTPAPREEALRELQKNISFPVHETYDYLSVVVFDRDPQRAAQIANRAVAELNEINTELSATNATSYARSVESRYQEAEAALDSVMSASQAFQRRYGILDLDVQTQAYFSQLAEARGRAEATEIDYDALRAQYGSENPEVQLLGEAVAASDARIREMMNGSEATLPVPLSDMSGVVRQYADLQREGEVQRQILEAVQPLVEQARFEKEKRIEAVQVVDAAVAPAKKAKPSRAILVATATLSGFLLSGLFVIALAAWRRNSGYVSARLHAAGSSLGR